MNRTIDALKAAQLCLAGDKVFGYSNILGTLSALVSHEHFQLDDVLLALILETLADDQEPDFRIRDKVNLARAVRLDQRTVDVVGG
jgi:hypothetical protein